MIRQAHSLATPRIPAIDIPPTRALSLWQPWASLCFTPFKRHETRHWYWDHRGTLAIHAAQKLVTDLDPELIEILADEFGGHWATELPRGRMLGLVEMTGCHRTESLEIDRVERMTGNWTPGRYAFRLEQPRLFDDPPLTRGHQSHFTWPKPPAASAGSLL